MQWLLWALSAGLLLLFFAMLADWWAARRSASSSKTGNVQIDQFQPTYVTQTEIDGALGPAGSNRREGTVLEARLAHKDFLPAKGAAQIENTRVLMVDKIGSAREIVPVLAAYPALVCVASEWDEEAVKTLVANRRALHRTVLGCSASHEQQRELALLVGGTPLGQADLQAGYVPDDALGHAVSVTADMQRSWWIS